ncbi:hypothetical protein [Methanobrevibacter sp. V14]|uniref:hypothetical protein n=1 Tax=Methanobrevibacter sp. V14 TaxID=3064280 RepID=UPI00273513FD|nr:hypothetical protein [Methanobrevibacter sp. V14]
MSNLNEKDIANEAKERKPLIQNKGLPDKLVNNNGDVSPVTTLTIMINNKQDKLMELEKAIDKELDLELTYLHKANEWRLSPDKIKEKEGLSKLPTEKQITAFVETFLRNDYDAWRTAKANTSLIRQQLDLINDHIKLEKYAIRLELNKE